MNNKVITVATHTFERANLIKLQLEQNGVDCWLKNINLIQGAFSGGVKIQIKEEDLQKALAVIEHFNESLYLKDESKNKLRKVLIPIDFSEYTDKACIFGMDLAKTLKTEVVFFHTYFSPISSSLPFAETFSYDIEMSTRIHDIEQKAATDMDAFMKNIERRMNNGELASVPVKFEIKEGVPEEEILHFSKEINPLVIVMGSRGANKKNSDLIGSVTAEIIERANVPVLAIPENTPFSLCNQVKNIVYVTSFDKKEFESFEKLHRMIGVMDIKVYCIHVGNKSEDPWDKLKLVGMEQFLTTNYNLKNVTCEYVEGEDILMSIEEFVKDKNIDIIALTTRKRNIISRLFNPGLAHNMVFHTDTPMLVFHT